MTKTRLSLDLGSTSIGWALFDTDDKGEPISLKKTGVRIFSNGRDSKKKESLNKKRQEVRSIRRRQDRIVQRRKALIKYLVKLDFMPENDTERKSLELLNPYELRAQGIAEALPVYHIGRALFHLSQKRGFKSNRKTDNGGNDSGAIKEAIAKMEVLLLETDSKTVGEFFHKKNQKRETVLSRPTEVKLKNEYDFYLHRSMIEDEFKAIWEKQKQFNAVQYSDENYKIIHEIIFYQRKLKSQKENVGKCTLLYHLDTMPITEEIIDEADKYRCSKAMPTFQNFIIAQDLVNLAWIDADGNDHKIVKESPALFHQFYDTLCKGGNVSYKQMRTALKKACIIDEEYTFNFEGWKEFKGADTAHKLSHKKGSPLQGIWDTWDIKKQNGFVNILLDDQTEDDEALQKMMAEYSLDKDTAEHCLNIGLTDGYGGLSQKAMDVILPCIIEQGLRYDLAVIEAGFDSHSDFSVGDGTMDKLPYYAKYLDEYCAGGVGDGDTTLEQLKKSGANQRAIEQKEFGRIGNPTVHIGLMQIEAVVNDIIKHFGTPDFATIEVARDLQQSKKQKDGYNKKNKANKENNYKWKKDLESVGEKNNSRNRLLMALWHELNWKNANDRQCPFTGTQISFNMLFNNDVEIEHIIPYSVGLDDSKANKTLCVRQANRDKGARTPYEAFGHSPDGYNWDDIYKRSRNLPRNKMWRFNINAMEEFEKLGCLADRHLNDTRYLSTVARKYLELIIPNKSKKNIFVVPGRLTSILRGKWGLDELLYSKADLPEGENIFVKNRNDHRHHAIDAIVIGCTSRSMLHRISTQSKFNKEKSDKTLANMPVPWDNFREDAKKSISNIVISYKTDRYPQGQLHEETFYGKVGDVLNKRGNPTKKGHYVIRKDLSYFDNRKKIETIRCPALKGKILDWIGDIADEKDLKISMEEYTKETGVRRAKTIVQKDGYISLGHRHVAGGNNFAVDIYTKGDDKWYAETIQAFDANKKGFIPQWAIDNKDNPNSKRIMRLHKQDLIELEIDRIKKIMRVQNLADGGLHFVHNIESNTAAREKELRSQNYWVQSVGAKLKQYNPRKVHISPSGFIRYEEFCT